MDFNTMQQRYRDGEITDHLKREEAFPVSKQVTATFYIESIDDETVIEEKLEEMAQELEDHGAGSIKLKCEGLTVER